MSRRVKIRGIDGAALTEADVIRRAGENAFAIDREKLDMPARKGCIGNGLRQRAILVAERMLQGLNREKAKDLPERQ